MEKCSYANVLFVQRGDIIKIAFVITGIHHISGIATITSNIANGLVGYQNVNVTIITLTKKSDFLSVKLSNQINVINLFDYPINLKKNIFKVYWKLRNVFKKEKFDIVVSPVLVTYLVHLAIKTSFKSKVISWDHAAIPRKKNIIKLEYWIRRYAVQNSDKLVIITQSAKEIYKKRYPVKNKLHLIYNSIKFNEDIDFEYNQKSRKIVSAGTLENIKGFDLAIEAAEKLFNNNNNLDWEWHIYGEGSEKQRLTKLIEEKGLDNKIILKGRTLNLRDELQNYSIFVMTSRKEAFGLVLLEALESYLPLIAFDCEHGPKEMISNEHNGYLIPQNDTDLMSKRINELIVNKDKRIKMSEVSKMKKNEFNISKITKQWYILLNNLKNNGEMKR